MIGHYEKDLQLGWQCIVPITILYNYIPEVSGDYLNPPDPDDVELLDIYFNKAIFGESVIPASWFNEHQDWKMWLLDLIDNTLQTEDFYMDLLHYARTE